MSRLGLGMRMLAGCGSSWHTAGPRVTPLGSATLTSCHSMRPASTASLKKEPKATKAAKGATAEVLSKGKKAKTTTVEAVPTKNKKKAAAASTKTDAPAATAAKKVAEASEKPLPVRPGKKARVSMAKTSAVAAEQPKVTAADSTSAATTVSRAKAAATTKPNKTEAAAPTSAAVTEAGASHSAAASTSTSTHLHWPRTASSARPRRGIARPIIPVTPSRPASPYPITPTADGKKPPISTSSPEYKRAKRIWTATIVALPIFLVTSYFLYDRLIDQFLLNRNSTEGPVERLRRARESNGTEKGGV